jgi:hypothetical protein
MYVVDRYVSREMYYYLSLFFEYITPQLAVLVDHIIYATDIEIIPMQTHKMQSRWIQKGAESSNQVPQTCPRVCGVE